jgi:hypothetical protein
MGKLRLIYTSWCPNFDSFQVETPLWIGASKAQYCAGFKTGHIAHAVPMVDSRELRVEGFRVDEIEEVLPCPWEGQDHTTDSSTSVGIAMLLMWEMKCLELSQRVYHPKSEVPAAHWQTLIANKHSDNTIYTGDGREVYDLLRIRLRKKMTDQLSENAATKSRFARLCCSIWVCESWT